MSVTGRVTEAASYGEGAFSAEKMTFLSRKLGKWHRESWQSATEKKIDLKIETLIKNIILGNDLNNLSFDDGLKCIPPGADFKVSPGGESVECYINWKKIETEGINNIEPAETLCQYVSNIISQGTSTQYYVVRLTGGLDSTGILLALLESVSADRIVAVTHRYIGGSCNADEFASRELCKKYNIRLLVLDIDPGMLFNPISEHVAPILNTRYAAISFHRHEKTRLSELFGEDFRLFDGHGGDQVFCEVIPSLLIKDLLFSLQPLKAISTIMKMSRLDGVGVCHIINLHKYEKKHLWMQASKYFSSELSLHHSDKFNTLSEQRRSILEEAIIDNGLCDIAGSFSCWRFPFTCKNMIKYGFNLKVENSFNSVEKRIQYRESVLRRFNVRIKRTQKGHITGVYQAAVRDKKAAIINLIKNGELSRRCMINTPAIISDLDRISSGTGGFNFILFKIIVAELILKECKING